MSTKRHRTRRQSYSRRSHQINAEAQQIQRGRHELIEEDGVMMSVHWTEEPTAEARETFRELARQIATGAVTMPLAASDPRRDTILDVRQRAGLEDSR